MHKPNDATVALREGIFEYARKRLEYDPAPLDAPQTFEYLSAHAGPTVAAMLGGSVADADAGVREHARRIDKADRCQGLKPHGGPLHVAGLDQEHLFTSELLREP